MRTTARTRCGGGGGGSGGKRSPIAEMKGKKGMQGVRKVDGYARIAMELEEESKRLYVYRSGVEKRVAARA